MSDEITVSVVEFSDRKFFMLRYVDPDTGQLRHESSKIERSKGKKGRQDAERKAAKLEHDLRHGRHSRPTTITWAAFRERYEEHVLPGLAENTGTKVCSVFNALEEILPIVRDGRLSALTSQRISYLQAQLRTTGRNGSRSESTIAGYMAHLHAALQWAVDQEMLPKMPAIRKPKRAKKIKSTTPMKGRPITTEEFERMLGSVEKALTPKATKRVPSPAKPEAARVETWKHYLRGLWLSGLRLSESLDLYWDRPDRLCIDLTGPRPMLAIPAELEKGHKDRLLPIAPEFAEFLLATPKRERRGRVFKLRTGKTDALQLSRYRVGSIVSRIGKAAGVKVRTDPKSGTVKYASAHDLRRSFGERWSRRLFPQDLMELMRHESITTTMRFYVGRNAQRTADAVWEAYERENGQSNTLGNSSPKSAEKRPDGPPDRPAGNPSVKRGYK